ncbi:MAG: Type 1 glutamine amidotransferase-like domain-containing protein [Candidatus Limnocylindrales bacterium]
MNQPSTRTIVAIGGIGFEEPYNPLIDDHVLELARRNRGRVRPRVCFLPTASGDSPPYIAAFYAAFARRSEASHLALFGRTVDDLDRFLLDQDVIHVGGGNTANMLAVWRVHGLDRILARAWDAGIVLAGTSAGANCWFECSSTDSFGPLAALNDGLGFLAGSYSPHYDREPARRPLFRQLIGQGTMADGYASDDAAALVFSDRDLVEVVASHPGARGYRVVRGPAGDVIETELPTRYLG